MHQLVRRDTGGWGITFDLGQLVFHCRRLAIEPVGPGQNFRKVHCRHADAVALQKFFAVADGVERAGPRADGPKAHAAQAVDHPAHGEEILQVGSKAG